MKHLKTFALLVLASFYLLSCKANHNGNYIIYNNKSAYQAIDIITPVRNRNEEIERVLRSTFMGKKFKFTFNDDYIAMDGASNDYNNIILNRRLDADSVLHYYGEKTAGKATFKFRLLKNDTDYLILGVDCELPRKLPPFPQSAYAQLLQDRSPVTTGRVIFWLKKTD